MTNITLTEKPSRAEWTQIFNERSFRTESGAVKFQGRNGSRYALTLQWLNVTAARRHTVFGEIKQLDGGKNRAVVPPAALLGYVRIGLGGGTPLLVGAHAAGATVLNIDGATASVTGYLGIDDWINVANELHSVVATMNTNGSGVGAVSIWPPLMQARADNTPVVIAAASVFGVFFQTAPVAFPLAPYMPGSASEYIISESVILSLEQDILG